MHAQVFVHSADGPSIFCIFSQKRITRQRVALLSHYCCSRYRNSLWSPENVDKDKDCSFPCYSVLTQREHQWSKWTCWKIKTSAKGAAELDNWADTTAEPIMSALLSRLWRSDMIQKMTREVKIHAVINHQSMLFVHPGVLELFAVSQGVIGIKGAYSNRFLAMNKRGRLHATVSVPYTPQTASVTHSALSACTHLYCLHSHS